jgi:site-specific recombinase XerD
VSELVQIEIGDVDLDACKIFINRGKGAKDRYILFPASFRLMKRTVMRCRSNCFGQAWPSQAAGEWKLVSS